MWRACLRATAPPWPTPARGSRTGDAAPFDRALDLLEGALRLVSQRQP
jgi:hypothetical protein